MVYKKTYLLHMFGQEWLSEGYSWHVHYVKLPLDVAKVLTVYLWLLTFFMSQLVTKSPVKII